MRKTESHVGLTRASSRSACPTVRRREGTADWAPRSWATSLLDGTGEVEDRHVHREENDADHAADDHHHQRLEQRGERADRDVDFFLVEVRNLVEHLIERARL